MNRIVVLILVADQAVKWLIRSVMTEGQTIPILGDLVRLTYVHNTGAAFGILPRQTWLLIAVTLVALGFMAWYRRRLAADERAARIGLSLIMGGALGNLIDRVWFQKVTDFIELDIPDISLGPMSFFGVKWEVHLERWPAFNIADSAISVGLVLLVWFLWREPEARPVVEDGVIDPRELLPGPDWWRTTAAESAPPAVGNARADKNAAER